MGLKIRIKKQIWTFHTLSGKKYEKMFGTDSVAISVFTNNEATRCVYFKGKPSKATICHELIHIFLSYTNFGDAENTPDENEEIVCESLERNLKTILRITEKVYAGK